MDSLDANATHQAYRSRYARFLAGRSIEEKKDMIKFTDFSSKVCYALVVNFACYHLPMDQMKSDRKYRCIARIMSCKNHAEKFTRFHNVSVQYSSLLYLHHQDVKILTSDRNGVTYWCFNNVSQIRAVIRVKCLRFS